MIKQPDQQIHDELIKRSSQLGYKTFLFLPPLGTFYPFVVMGEVLFIASSYQIILDWRC